MFVYRSSKQFQSNTGMYRVKRVTVLGQTGSVDSVHRSESSFIPVEKVGYHPIGPSDSRPLLCLGMVSWY